LKTNLNIIYKHRFNSKYGHLQIFYTDFSFRKTDLPKRNYLRNAENIFLKR
jgi:hypothetical protein